MSEDWNFDPEQWDWSRALYDHVQLHVRDLEENVRFYRTVLEPLGIPMVYARDSAAEFPNLALVTGRPPSGPSRRGGRDSHG